jgi:microcystin-dependent protein
MSDQFVGEIRAFGFDFAPVGWAKCDGQVLPISQNTGLFALLGTVYGGDGKATFALPDLRGRVPIQQGDAPTLSAYDLGEDGGTGNVKLNGARLPRHTHVLSVAGDLATERQPPGQLLAPATGVNYYDTTAPNALMAVPTLANTGSGFPHNNMQPFNTLLYCIALTGTFPSKP